MYVIIHDKGKSAEASSPLFVPLEIDFQFVLFILSYLWEKIQYFFVKLRGSVFPMLFRNFRGFLVDASPGDHPTHHGTGINICISAYDRSRI